MTGDAATLATVEQAEQLLFREARLLDSRRYEAWLELFTHDGLYWLPARFDGESEGATRDAHDDVHIIYDNAERRDERVWRTLHTPVLDQRPPSRTIHLITNVEVDPEPVNGGDTRVWCCQLINEMRPGGPGQVGLNEPRRLAARGEYHLRNLGGEWRIALKKLSLLNADQRMFNLAFLI